MRILLITDELPPLVIGGAGRIVWETSVALARLGHDVHILTAAEEDAFPEKKENVTIHTIPMVPRRWAHYRSVFSGRRGKEVLNIIDRVQPDLIHAHDLAWQIGYWWIAPATKRGIRCVYTAHGVMTVAYGKVLEHQPHSVWQDLKRVRWEYNPLRNFCIRCVLALCSRIITVSDALKNFLAFKGLKNLQTIRNGIDLNFWKEQLSKEEARKQLGIHAEKTVFLFAGRIGHDKGSNALDNTLPAGSLLAIAGDASAGALKNINQQVLSFPNQSAEQMRLLYAACDVAVVPSIYLDPFPTVCLEAMACSRPVIATCFGGSKEAVKDGITGWIVNPLDEPQLKNRLQWCVDHPEEWKKAGIQARMHMEQNFSVERYVKELMEVYMLKMNNYSKGVSR